MSEAALDWAAKGGKPRAGAGRGRRKDTAVDKVVMEARVRLARNIEGAPFPDWALRPQRERIREKIFRRIRKTRLPLGIYRVEDLDPFVNALMFEDHAVSLELIDRDGGAGLVEAKDDPHGEDHRFNVMINEEDHVRIQVIDRKPDLLALWKEADSMDDELSKVLRFAWSERLGYLTACPSNLGTGLRASVMMHLPGLGLLQELDAVIRGLERLDMLVRGDGGEGTEGTGHIYQISNAASLGFSEIEILYRVDRMMRTVADLEIRARERLLRDRPDVLKDSLSRTLALLKNARLLSPIETLSLFSIVRMGLAQGWISRWTLSDFDIITLNVLPAHFVMTVKKMGKDGDMDADEANAERARWLNALFSDVDMNI